MHSGQADVLEVIRPESTIVILLARNPHMLPDTISNSSNGNDWLVSSSRDINKFHGPQI